MIPPFSFSQIPKIIFGPGKISTAPGIAASIGRNVLVVASPSFVRNAAKFDALAGELEKRSMRVTRLEIGGEPSPDFIDAAVEDLDGRNINVVIAV
ncbi:MAG TPA: iron-containing alcohol dehydrogenase, partial [bacterium]|nr:iron-containing alcohol dehydrogenase [bacterium]